MVYINNNSDQMKFTCFSLNQAIPEDHDCRFIKKILKNKYSYLDEQEYKKMGRPSYRKSSLLSIVVYANYDNVTSGAKMSEYCKYNLIYKYVGDDIQPDERTFQRFIKNNHELINDVLKYVTEIAYELGLTKYEHISQDGTIIKSHNSPYNVIKLEEIESLLEILEKQYTEDQIKEKGYKLKKTSI